MIEALEKLETELSEVKPPWEEAGLDRRAYLDTLLSDLRKLEAYLRGEEVSPLDSGTPIEVLQRGLAVTLHAYYTVEAQRICAMIQALRGEVARRENAS